MWEKGGEGRGGVVVEVVVGVGKKKTLWSMDGTWTMGQVHYPSSMTLELALLDLGQKHKATEKKEQKQKNIITKSLITIFEKKNNF